jgi:hypothetical protein
MGGDSFLPPQPPAVPEGCRYSRRVRGLEADQTLPLEAVEKTAQVGTETRVFTFSLDIKGNTNINTLIFSLLANKRLDSLLMLKGLHTSL